MFSRFAAACTAFAFAASGGAAVAADAQRADFGTLPDGRKVEVITLSNSHGHSARVLSYGAILQALKVPDRKGKSEDVIEGYNDLAGYLAKPNYFGSTVGRYANRIGAGRFMLDGQAYTLAKNDGPNTLHGGMRGFDKQLWQVLDVSSGPVAHVTMSYVSPDGEEGYPGTLKVTVTYSLDEQGTLSIEYRATTDKATVVNLTGHSYFNLSGEGSGHGILNHLLTIPAQAYTPVDDTLIPTGEIRAVAGTPFDFRKPVSIGERLRDGSDRQMVLGRGYDHNWVIQKAPSTVPVLHARLTDPRSGRQMEVWSNQPGLQFYSGNFIDGTIVGKSGKVYRQSDALCLEPQVFPDTPNKPQFGSARLDPGKEYVHTLVYRFSTVR
ncbi:galactose mutarotase [Novosphingobium flavum]|uniref:Aldose 1-epimerase n=1 Tax=Novosphingobium flavum TaxID=1778672 RepID=A0A7X1KLV2_9SPHN|nr:aldose epimerase family protein [Novosphingobium flavum]MBC2665981.1 galactose mutarotase [Novosphingobium flavum]